jgi:hypothetical protein
VLCTNQCELTGLCNKLLISTTVFSMLYNVALSSGDKDDVAPDPPNPA